PDSGQTSVYGATLAALTFTSSGFGNGDTSTLLTGQLGTAATSSSPVGTYAFTLGTLSAGSNYTLQLAATPPTFVVAPAALTITADDASMVQGSTLPALTARFTG